MKPSEQIDRLLFLDLIAALDALPEKRLVKNELETAEGAVCALGALGKHKGVDMTELDTEDYPGLGETFNISERLAQETMHMNDERWEPHYMIGPRLEEGAQRWRSIREWAISSLKPETLVPE